MVRSATLVIPTFRRPDGLTRVLRAVALQDDPGVPWDVVVVDNDDPPGAEATFAAAAADLAVPARLVREAHRGASPTRNRGVVEATGDVVVFLDDDVVPARDWLRRLLEPILAGRCDGVGGRVVLDPEVPRPRWLDEAGGMAGYLAAHDPADRERELDDGEFVITANAAFERGLLVSTGGFDPQLGPRAGTQLVNDDVLVCDRFVAAGGRVRHVPDAVVVHELPAVRLRPGYLLRRAWTQGRSDWIYFTMTIGRRAGVSRLWGWYTNALGRRRRAGLGVAVAFHAACDVARLAGAVREAVVRLPHGGR
jgi:glycosyltransferase involved in cell wall biosynthesis